MQTQASELTMPSVLAAASARPLRWWNQAVLQALSRELRARLLSWCGEWGLALGRVRVCNAAGAYPPAHALNLPGAALWGTGHGEDMMHLLLFEEAPGVRADGRSMAQEIAGKAWASWVATLGQVLVPSEAAASQEFGPPGYWSGALLLEIELRSPSPSDAADEFKLWVQPQRAVSLAAPYAVSDVEKGTTGALQRIETVLAERRVHLAVQLAEVEIDLGSLQSLQIDDVIPLPHPLGQALELRLSPAEATEPSSAPLCWAHLGRRGEHKAIELVRQAHA
ncbi:MAG TPA: FliM/FliN family flagellar motor C-terminal domain-containing protein [Anaerolineae bacterium]|nr:FliM/FliN family flagellar motor C-terminal domain-containing protein [Anaerolineae bacterium]